MNATAIKFAAKLNSHLGTSVDVDAASLPGEDIVIYGSGADMDAVIDYLSAGFSLVRIETDDEEDETFAAFAIAGPDSVRQWATPEVAGAI